jgi:streptogramin lyase
MATFDFEARLRLQLREAAEREQRRGRLARLRAAGRALLPTVGHSVLPAAAVAAAVAAAIAVAAIVLTSGSERRAVAPPKVVGQFTVADSLGSTVAAYGSIWMNDTSRDELLRIDPRSRRVEAGHRYLGVTTRLPVQGEVSLASGGGALWALQKGSPRAGDKFRGPLLRIDPTTNRVTARIALRTPAGQPFAGFEVVATRDHVWVGGSEGGALRIDPHTNRVSEVIAPPGGLVAMSLALRGDGLWALTADGRLQRFDPRTGATGRQVPLTLDGAWDLRAVAREALVAAVPGGLARLDPHTGHAVWRRQLGQRISAWTEAGGRLWVRSSGQVHDRLSALDLDTGRVMTSIDLDDVGGSGVAAIDDELWLTTVAGNVVILQQ